MKYLLVFALAILSLNACNSASEPSVKESEKNLPDTVYMAYCGGPVSDTVFCEALPQKCRINPTKDIDKTDMKHIKIFCNGEWHPYRPDSSLAFPK